MSNYGIVNDNSKDIIKWHKNGMSCYAIAKNLGCAKVSVLRFLKSENIDTSRGYKPNPNGLLKNKNDIVIKMYKSGISQNQIAKKLGYSGGEIGKLLNRHNIKIRPRNKYCVNETFFDKIDTEEKAYILGMFYSDGCVDNIGKMRIQLQSEDKYLLEKIAKIMNYDGPMYHINPPKRFPHRKHQDCLSINRKKLADQLINTGCVPNKSLILKFPKKDIVSDNLVRHFVRGYFDGDGSIMKHHGWQICIVSTLDFLNILNTYLPFEPKFYDRHPDKNLSTRQMMFWGISNVEWFLNWLYKNSIIHMDRKFSKYQQFLRETP